VIRVEVNPLYPLDKRINKGHYEFPEGCSAKQALELLGFSPKMIREIRVAINGSVIEPEYQLEDGCTIVLIPTLAGG
jgi:molybdopterin converting factor small subunit